MDKLFPRNYLGLATLGGVAIQTLIPTIPAIAEPIKKCPPVIRSLKTQKLYCAHELKALQKEKDAGFLCFFLRAIIPPNDWIKTNQCFPKTNFSSETGKKIIPRPKGSRTAFKLLKPLGNIQLTPQPSIAWQPVANTRYRVTVEHGGRWLWSHTTKTTEITLPASKPLKEGNTYKISVVAFRDKKPIAEDVTTVRLVKSQQIQDIDDLIQQAHNLSPDPLSRGLDKAMMLYHLGLLDAAVKELRTLTQYQEPEVYSQLGLIHQEAGQRDMAQDYFDKASELAKRQSKPISQLN
ncbi:tetratricopeptide repeat protein [Acaryochloris marina NIES-2412]|uniref:tetratricopeptide repeat protein n=1 Tax=Acaryochloris marina TaxID=155978 RepID=UPI004059002A